MKYIAARTYHLLILIGITLCNCSPFSVSDYTEDLGEGYVFVSESNSNQLITGPNDTTGQGLIPCTVQEYTYDNQYIIAKQKSNRDCLETNLSKISPSYWIIDKENKVCFGPLDSLAYDKKRAQLSVSASLQL